MSHRTVGQHPESHIGNGKAGSLPSLLEGSSAIGREPLQAAGNKALRQCLKKVRKTLTAVGAVADAEAVHDARVAVRELRAMCALLEPAPGFEGKWLRKLDRGLRQPARTLGTVRDTDVFLTNLHVYVGRNAEASAGLVWLERALRKRRKQSASQLARALESESTHRLLEEANRRMRRPAGASGASASQSANRALSGQGRPSLIRHFAGSAIWERYQEILSYETALPEAEAETLHKLRIACKRLRYSMQIFGSTPVALADMMASLKAAQDQLGRLHDAFYAEQLTRELQAAWSPASSLANRSYHDFLETLARDRQKLQAGITPSWEQLTGLPMRQTLAGFIASL